MSRKRSEVARHLAEFRTLAEQTACGVMRTDADRRCNYVNPGWCQLTGTTPAQALVDGWQSALHPDDRERVVAAWRSLAPFDERFRLVRPDGEVRQVHGTAAPIVDEGGEHLGTIATVRDETDTRRREAELADANREVRARVREAEARNRELVQLHEMGDLLHSSLELGDIRAVLSAYLPTMFPGSSGAVYLLASSRHLVEATAVWGQPLDPSFAPSECWALRRSAFHHPLGAGLRCQHLRGRELAHVCLPMMAHGEMTGVIVVCHEEDPILERSLMVAKAAADQVAFALANLRLRESLRSQSIRDPLTGLYNRRYLEETFDRELARVRRKADPLSVLMIDVDLFKGFNDSYGHAAADQVLRELGGLLSRSFRHEDIVCRIGGEEFVAIVPGASIEEAEIRAECLRAAVAIMPVRHEGSPLGAVTISIGVAAAFEHGESPDDLLRAADAALYRAKATGRDRVVIAGSWQRDPSPPPAQH